MKTNQVAQLREVIRTIVRQEVKTVVQEEVSKAMAKVLVEMVKEIKKPVISNASSKTVVNESVEEIEAVEEEPAEEHAPAPSNIAVINTNNPKLSAALAETSRNFRGLPRGPESSLAGMMEGFEKVGEDGEVYTETPTTNIGFMKQMITENAAPSTPSVLDVKNQLPAGLAKLFTGKNLGNILKKSKEPGAGSGASMLVGTM
jgi:hypothetical protein